MNLSSVSLILTVLLNRRSAERNYSSNSHQVNFFEQSSVLTNQCPCPHLAPIWEWFRPCWPRAPRPGRRTRCRCRSPTCWCSSWCQKTGRWRLKPNRPSENRSCRSESQIKMLNSIYSNFITYLIINLKQFW